ncbi:acetyl-CoA carboxylase [Rhizobium sp. AC44/96]|jgi:biotin carboxyl carrier protein|uniref:acetyl-CoA carboxylase n=1 Tax=Rhizobium sp. AC44/96 TaxID=1841654 RepID=UPI00080FDFC4|nr:acetyl-CoA carboxylase [Rhizobium sp. AC44/96]OCJ16343.1 acetyl-CoA carboxylase [Rhizobium sp. AC44/96]
MSTIGLTDPVTIATLSDALTKAGVEGVEITTRDGHLRIVVSGGKSAAISHSAPSSAVSSADSAVIKAPIAGYFRPAAAAAGETEREVMQGEPLGFMVIGPILVPMLASSAGILRRKHAEPEDLIGFGTPLFELEKTS